ncbi:MAG TPA: helicase-related protein [Thermotogota bacterium]|nr:helicase-related protein [Thermotogota bacterium]
MDPLFAKLKAAFQTLRAQLVLPDSSMPDLVSLLLEHRDWLDSPTTWIAFPDSRQLNHFFQHVLEGEKWGTHDRQFPPMDILPFEPVHVSFSALRQRMKTLLSLREDTPDAPDRRLVFSTLPVLIQKTLHPQALEQAIFSLSREQAFPQSQLLDRLVHLGYERAFQVTEPGEFAHRGFIVDFYPLSSDFPVRVEWFDEQIVDLRLFDFATQKSTGKLDRILVTPARETFFGSDGAALFQERLQKLQKKYPASTFLAQLADNPSSYPALGPMMANHFSAPVQFLDPNTRFLLLDPLQGIARLRAFEKELFELHPGMEMKEVYFKYLRISESVLFHLPRCTYVVDEPLESLPGEKGAIPTWEVGKPLPHAKKKETGAHPFAALPSVVLSSWEDLEPGTLVVHEDYGIGKYLENARITNFSGTREYLKILYAKDVQIFVPVENIERVHQYIGDEATVELTDLKSGSWSRTRKKVRQDLEQKIQALMELWASRTQVQGTSFPPDYELESRFADSFPHLETRAQQQAITQVLGDMEKAVPMDRLLFGDAGSGKTEVAMRGAFRCVLNGYQVALMVPTTVLARQHYETFSNRFEGFGVSVRILDRFVTSSQSQKTLAQLAEGKVDILIGTHSLLSKKVQFHKLGLLIIDEEQKFGVMQKERIKAYKQSVEVLTLSATPIPRTLYQGFAGIKEMSIIDEMPPGRIPVEVLVSHFNEKMVRTGILREISRGGQVIFVHNRVEDIMEVLLKLQKLVPDVSIEVAHGQMKKSHFEKTLDRFYHGELDVLLCTTIIESGVDIPNANTLILDDSQRYGLSQLYQLRGRVGRSDRRAFAYFLFPPHFRNNEKNRARLDAIRDFTGAGSGLKLAQRDMEIRGIGNLLGIEQHGSIFSIGLHLYRQTLDQVLEIKGLKPTSAQPTQTGEKEWVQVELNGFYMDVLIPEAYVANHIERMKLYRQVARATTLEQLSQVALEIRDRFGPLPGELEQLLFFAKIRLLAHGLGIHRIEKQRSSEKMLLFFSDERDVDDFSLFHVRGFKKPDETQVLLFVQQDSLLFDLLERNTKKGK